VVLVECAFGSRRFLAQSTPQARVCGSLFPQQATFAPIAEAMNTGAPPAPKRARGWDITSDPYRAADGSVTIPTVTELQSRVATLQKALIAVSSELNTTPAQKQERAQRLNRRMLAAQALVNHMTGRGSGAAVAALGEGNSIAPIGSSTAEGPVEQRRVYVGNMMYDWGEGIVRAAFAPFGPLVAVDLSAEPGTGLSKGYAFLEFTSAAAAEAAMITMNGFDVSGRQIRVGRPQSAGVEGIPVLGQGNLAHVTAEQLLGMAQQATRNLKAMGMSGGVPNMGEGGGGDDARVYIGGVPYEITAEHLKAIFEPFGTIAACELVASVETAGTHRGYGFIEFTTEQAAANAIASMNGFAIAGKSLKVGKATSGGAAMTGMTHGLATVMAQAGVTSLQQAGSSSEGAAAPPATHVAAAPTTTGTAVGTTATEAAATPAAGPTVDSSQPSRVIRMLNMVTPEQVDAELKLDVAEEAALHGPVESVQIHTADGAVRVFVEFKTPQGAAAGSAAMHGRLFDGRTIEATLYDEAAFLQGNYTL